MRIAKQTKAKTNVFVTGTTLFSVFNQRIYTTRKKEKMDIGERVLEGDERFFKI